MRITDLPKLDEGDYGWAVLWDETGTESQVVLYDDCGFDDEDGHPYAICRQEPLDPETFVVPFDYLFQLPEHFPSYYRGSVPSSKQGWIYAVSLVPSLDLGRIKVGWTADRLAQRLRSYRTANPDCLLLGFWDADRSTENSVLVDLAKLGRRVGRSEVFQFDDPWEAITRIADVVDSAEELATD